MVMRHISAIINGGGFQDAFKLALATGLSQVLLLIAMPILARCYSPDSFGVLAIFGAVVAVIANAITLRFELNIVLPKTEVEADRLAVLSFMLAIVLGSAFTALAYLLPNSMRVQLGVGVLNGLFPLACLMGVIAAVNATVTAKLSRANMYGRLASWRLLQSVLYICAAILLGYLENTDGLIISQIGSAVLVCLIAVYYMPTVMGAFDLRAIFMVAKKHKSAPQYSLPISLLDTITMQLPLVLIGTWYGSDVAGQFSMAWRVLVLPVSLVGGAVGQVFFQRFAVAWPDANAARSLLIKSWLGLAIIGLVPMVVLVLFGEMLFVAVFGVAWAESGRMASILAPMLFASLIHSPTSTASVVLGIQKKVFYLSIVVLLYRPLALYVGWKFNDIYLGLRIYLMLEIIQITMFQFGVYLKIKNN